MYWFQGSVNLITIHRQKHHKLHSVHPYMPVRYEIFSHFQTYAFPSLISLPLISKYLILFCGLLSHPTTQIQELWVGYTSISLDNLQVGQFRVGGLFFSIILNNSEQNGFSLIYHPQMFETDGGSNL
jgi:hypothetical protein